MIARNRSGEIVNATLMEIFVVLSFIFLVYSTMVEEVNAGEVDKLASEYEVKKRELEDKLWQIQQNLDRTQAEKELCVDKLVKAKIPRPLCDMPGKYYGTIWLLDDASMRVDIPEAHRSIDFSGSRDFTWSEFVERFADLNVHTRGKWCALSVRVVDRTSAHNKQGFKKGLEIVRDYFYETVVE